MSYYDLCNAGDLSISLPNLKPAKMQDIEGS